MNSALMPSMPHALFLRNRSAAAATSPLLIGQFMLSAAAFQVAALSGDTGGKGRWGLLGASWEKSFLK